MLPLSMYSKEVESRDGWQDDKVQLPDVLALGFSDFWTVEDVRFYGFYINGKASFCDILVREHYGFSAMVQIWLAVNSR